MGQMSLVQLLGAIGVTLAASMGYGLVESGGSARPSDPYPLATCPVSGKTLGAMGDAIVEEVDGREVRFCCPTCIGPFEESKEDYWKKIDAQIIAEQMAFYPLTTCPISGEEIGEHEKGVDLVYRNRLVRFCCKDCKKEFMEDPEPTLAKLDEAVVREQRAGYPFDTCLVSGEALGEMGDPHEVVIDNHLVRLCCERCEKKLRADPSGYLTKLDAAWKEKGMPHAGAGGDDGGKEGGG